MTATDGILPQRNVEPGYLWVLVLLLSAATFPIFADRTPAPISLGLVGLAITLTCWFYSRFSLASASTWILGYLGLSVVGRGLSLTLIPPEDSSIFRLTGTGTLLDQGIREVAQSSLIAIALFALGFCATRASPHLVRVRREARSGAPLLWCLLLLSCALLPTQAAIHSQANLTGGGTFLIDFPGYMAVGVLVTLVARLGAGSLAHVPLIVGLVGYAVLRLVLVESKFALLATGVALMFGLSVAPGQTRIRRYFLSVVRTGAVLAGLLIFSIPVLNGTGASPTWAQRLEVGTNALISRSYGLDAEIAARIWLDQPANEHLYGSSFADITYSWVPRQLWPEKPSAFSDWFGEHVFWFSNQAGERFFSPSYTGEWLLNFGLVGVMVGWLIFGFLAGRCDRLEDIGIRAACLLGLTHLVEGGMVSQFWLALPMIIGAALVRGRRPTEAVNGEPPVLMAGTVT